MLQLHQDFTGSKDDVSYPRHHHHHHHHHQFQQIGINQRRSPVCAKLYLSEKPKIIPGNGLFQRHQFSIR